MVAVAVRPLGGEDARVTGQGESPVKSRDGEGARAEKGCPQAWVQPLGACRSGALACRGVAPVSRHSAARQEHAYVGARSKERRGEVRAVRGARGDAGRAENRPKQHVDHVGSDREGGVPWRVRDSPLTRVEGEFGRIATGDRGILRSRGINSRCWLWL